MVTTDTATEATTGMDTGDTTTDRFFPSVSNCSGFLKRAMKSAIKNKMKICTLFCKNYLSFC